MNDGNKAKTATAPAVAVLAVDTQFHVHIPQLVPFRPELKDASAANDTMRTETMRFSGARQAGYFLLAVARTAWPRARWPASTRQDWTPNSSRTAAGSPSWWSTSAIPARIPWFGLLPRLDHADAIKWA